MGEHAPGQFGAGGAGESGYHWHRFLREFMADSNAFAADERNRSPYFTIRERGRVGCRSHLFQGVSYLVQHVSTKDLAHDPRWRRQGWCPK
ncbi:MAG: hypothetical protein LC745_11370, partial [Planctomycetia bacterium]|nr:hypothetical protein [Planctomycetia bacterium]